MSIYVIKQNLKNEVLEVLEQAEILILASLFVTKMKHCQFLLVLDNQKTLSFLFSRARLLLQFEQFINKRHCTKSFQIRSFFCSVFSRIRA